VEAANLLQRWKNLPAIDANHLRRDIDAIVDHDLQGNLGMVPADSSIEILATWPRFTD
jgi:hypothetical protein